MIPQVNRASIRKILVRGVNWIGDTILTLPTLEGLRRLVPQAQITLLARPHLCSLLIHSPLVDGLLPYPAGRGAALVHLERDLIADLRGRAYDLALILPRSLRAAIIPYLAAIPCRIGYGANHRSVFLTHAFKETEQLLRLHQVEYYYHLLTPLGAGGAWHMPDLPTTAEEDTWVDSFFTAAGIGAHHTLIAMNPGSTYGSAKCWDPVKYVQLGRRLLTFPRTRVLLVGGRDNAALIEFISLSLNGRALVAVDQDLIRLTAILKRCRLLITNDTGPMHIAAAVATPVIALFGSSNPITTGPLGQGHTIIMRQAPCSPCLKRHCPTDHRCMEDITVAEVEEAALRYLAPDLNSSTEMKTGLG